MTETITKDMVVDVPKKRRRTKKSTDSESAINKGISSADVAVEQQVDIGSADSVEVETVIDASIAESIDVKDTIAVEDEDRILESCSNDSSEGTFHAGDKIESPIGFRLFRSSVAFKPAGRIRGKFYVWDDEFVNGRVRITDSPTGVGVVSRCIGWANVEELKRQ